MSVGRGPAGWGRGRQRGPLGARGTAVQVSDPSSDPAPDPASPGTAPGLGRAGRPGPRADGREVGLAEPEPSDPRPATRPRPTPTRPLPGGLGPGVPAPGRLGKKVGGQRRGRRAWVLGGRRATAALGPDLPSHPEVGFGVNPEAGAPASPSAVRAHQEWARRAGGRVFKVFGVRNGQ